jgi:hypothetical protein
LIRVGDECKIDGQGTYRLTDDIDDVQRILPSEPSVRTDLMPELISGPSLVEKTDNGPIFYDTYGFPVRPGESHVQVQRLRCGGGWAEPEDTPASGHDEYILVLRGLLRVEHGAGVLDVRAGEGIIIRAGEQVRSSTPEPAGAEYIIVRLLGLPRESDHQGQE